MEYVIQTTAKMDIALMDYVHLALRLARPSNVRLIQIVIPHNFVIQDIAMTNFREDQHAKRTINVRPTFAIMRPATQVQAQLFAHLKHVWKA